MVVIKFILLFRNEKIRTEVKLRMNLAFHLEIVIIYKQRKIK